MPRHADNDDLIARLRAALAPAMRQRDRVAMSALRSALAAIDNAEAVDPAHAPRPGQGRIAGAVSGVGAAEVPRRTLSAGEAAQVVRAEIAQREAAAAAYERLGREEQAARLRAEAAVLAAHLPG